LFRRFTIPEIIIRGTPIDFPNTSASPQWAPAIIQFAQAVEEALGLVIGSFDIAPQIFDFTNNSNTSVSVTNLQFPVNDVRGAFISYTVFRTTSTNTVYEIGELQTVYNPDNSIGEKWEMTRSYTGDADITFSITDAGQVQFSTTAISGSGHSGVISFQATALLQ